MKAMLPFVLIAVGLIGCAHTERSISPERPVFMVNSAPWFQGYYYKGSDASHHYFVGKWDYATDERFKVKTSEMVVNKTMPVGKAEVEVSLWKLTSEYVEFGKIDNATLYMKK